MSQKDFEKWEKRYANADTESLGTIDPFFKEVEESLPFSGKALDLAGGTGRHALFLAQRGLDVTLIDVSPRGLAVADAAANTAGYSISTKALDLEEAKLPNGPFDLVLCSWYLLAPHLFEEISRVLHPDGRFVYVQPTPTHLERHKHPGRRFVIEATELETRVANAGLEILCLEAGWDCRDNHTARLMARKPGAEESGPISRAPES